MHRACFYLASVGLISWAIAGIFYVVLDDVNAASYMLTTVSVLIVLSMLVRPERFAPFGDPQLLGGAVVLIALSPYFHGSYLSGGVICLLLGLATWMVANNGSQSFGEMRVGELIAFSFTLTAASAPLHMTTQPAGTSVWQVLLAVSAYGLAAFIAEREITVELGRLFLRRKAS